MLLLFAEAKGRDDVWVVVPLLSPVAGRASQASRFALCERPGSSSTSPRDRMSDNDADDLLAAIRDKFESRMTAPEWNWCTPQVVAVYVSCRKTLPERVKMLGSAIEWRIKRRDMLSCRSCPSCAADPLSHDARMFGTDADGDVAFYNCFALHHDYNSSAIANHMACLFERALLHYPAGPSSTELRRWTWCIDMYGFGLQHTDPRTSLELLKLLECAYPERLKHMLIVGAPSVFWVLWRAVKPFIQEKTAAKIEFVAWSDAPQRYEELLGPTVAGRLVSEGVWRQHCDARTRSTARHVYAYALSRTAWHRMAPHSQVSRTVTRRAQRRSGGRHSTRQIS